MVPTNPKDIPIKQGAEPEDREGFQSHLSCSDHQSGQRAPQGQGRSDGGHAS